MILLILLIDLTSSGDIKIELRMQFLTGWKYETRSLASGIREHIAKNRYTQF